MQENLLKIDKWLAENAKRIKLNPPTDKETIDQFEKNIGKSLPSDFKELYLWHDGINHSENMGNLFYAYDFWSLEQCQSHYSDHLELVKSNDIVLKTEDKINPKSQKEWIQFTHDGSRSGFYLDLAPTDKGNYGQIVLIDYDYDIAFVVADSITTLVKQTIDDMKKGLYFLHEDALDDDVDFLEVDQKIDILNWHKSERWKIGNELDK